MLTFNGQIENLGFGEFSCNFDFYARGLIYICLFSAKFFLISSSMDSCFFSENIKANVLPARALCNSLEGTFCKSWNEHFKAEKVEKCLYVVKRYLSNLDNKMKMMIRIS